MSDQLGDHLATHRYSIVDEQRRLAQWIAITGAGALFLVSGVAQVGMLLLIGGAAMIVATSVEMAVRHARNGGGSIERYENGLRIALRGRAVMTVELDAVGAIVSRCTRLGMLDRETTPGAIVSPFLSLAAKRTPKDVWQHRVRIGEAELLLDRHWTEVHELVSALVAARTKTRLSEAKREIEAGNEVSFGPLTVTPEGVRVAARTLRWAELVDVSVQQGQVVVRRRPAGHFAAIDTREVPDTEALIELARAAPRMRNSYR